MVTVNRILALMKTVAGTSREAREIIHWIRTRFEEIDPRTQDGDFTEEARKTLRESSPGHLFLQNEASEQTDLNGMAGYRAYFLENSGREGHPRCVKDARIAVFLKDRCSDEILGLEALRVVAFHRKNIEMTEAGRPEHRCVACHPEFCLVSQDTTMLVSPLIMRFVEDAARDVIGRFRAVRALTTHTTQQYAYELFAELSKKLGEPQSQGEADSRYKLLLGLISTHGVTEPVRAEIRRRLVEKQRLEIAECDAQISDVLHQKESAIEDFADELLRQQEDLMAIKKAPVQ
ncbi:MAG: hypothetical protein WCJ29_03255 [bacterium]